MSTENLDSGLVLDAVRVTEIAAIAASTLVGRGDEKAADQAAVDAMRTALNGLAIDGEIVIGEGERDEAPMLYIGEKVGRGGAAIDIALDPLEGTTLTAKAMANALAVMAWAPKGTLLNAPDTYMDKIACGPGYPSGVIDLDRSPADNVRALAAAKGVAPEAITVCVLDRPRHAYLGQGGAPEGVLACAALKCVGGQFQGRLVFRNVDEKERARRVGITDLDKKYDLHEMGRADAIFAATGVTKGALLDGIRREGGYIITHSLVMNSSTGDVREVRMRRPA